MTVIVAMKAKGSVYMGCDSMFLNLETYQNLKRSQSKLMVKDEFIIGLTTANGCRVFQTLKFKLKLPTTKKVKTEDLLEYMTVTFCRSLHKLLHAENMLVEDPDKKNTEAEPCLSPAVLLVGIRDKIFQVGEDFDVAEIDMPFSCIGSGADYSLGSLEATTQLVPKQMDPEHHILYALKTAEKYTAGVKGPFQLVNTGDLCLLECS